jgi:hypothetical protein
LLILDSYHHLPEIKDKERIILSACYYELLLQFENLQLPLIELKRKLIVRIIDMVIEIVRTSKDVHKIEIASTVLRALMVTSDPDPEWLYKVDFTDQPSQKQLLSRLAVEIKRYNAGKKNMSSSTPVDIYEQAAQLEQLLGIQIDVMKCSVLKFMAYQKQAQKKIKLIEQWQAR